MARGPVTMAASPPSTPLCGTSSGQALNVPGTSCGGGCVSDWSSSTVTTRHPDIDDTVAAVASMPDGLQKPFARKAASRLDSIYCVGRRQMYMQPAVRMRRRKVMELRALPQFVPPPFRAPAQGIHSDLHSSTTADTPSHAIEAGRPRQRARAPSSFLARRSHASPSCPKGFRLIRRRTTTPPRRRARFSIPFTICQQLIQ